MRPPSSHVAGIPAASHRLTLLASLVGVLAIACGGTGGSDPEEFVVPTQEIATEISEELLAPLEGLGPCEGQAPEPVEHDIEGLVLPDSAVVSTVSPDGGAVIQVEGWIEMTPTQARASYVTRDDIDVISVDDEGFEAEVLLSNGTHRTFFKVQGICRTQSVFVALVSEELPEAADPPPTSGG